MLNFTFKQLRYVEAAGRHRSIAAAAAEQNISQSSITAAIDALESQLGHDLFVRTPAKGIQSTPSGRETLNLIRSFLDQSKHFEGEIRSVGGRTTGLIRVACYATAAPSFLPPILTSLRDTYPGVSVKLLEGHMQAVMDYLNTGEADIAFTYDRAVDERHEFQPLFAAPPYALIGRGTPLAGEKSVTLEQLSPLPMILLDLPMTREYFTSVFQGQSLRPNIVHTARSSEIVRALVASGYGYTILNIRPPNYSSGEHPFVAVPISSPIPPPLFGIAALDGLRQPKMVQAIVDHCLKLRRQGAFDQIVVA
ncbi:MAG: LysR family transcriptional regulator [Sedimentitalea sp.]